jgi:DNA-binding CsgD family transcriptional regulator
MSEQYRAENGDISREAGRICEPPKSASTLGSAANWEIPNGLGSVQLTSLDKMLDRIGLGYVILDEERDIVSWNYLAKAALDVRGEPKELRKELSSAFRRLIADAQCRISPGMLCWIVISHVSGRPVVVQEKCESIPDNQSVVFLLARDIRPQPNRLRLQKLFGFTGAETEVALSIACGHTLLEIAQSRNLSRTTIRSHLASLFAKTDTRRQSELMALLMNMAVLP